MAGEEAALIALTGTLVTVKVMSDVASGVKPQRSGKRKRGYNVLR